MRDFWICATRLFDGQALHDNMALWISGGHVAKVRPRADMPKDAQVQIVDGIVTPGFVDLQVNGGAGVLLNDTPTVAGMLAIAAAHRAAGTVAILPTVITDAPDVIATAVDAAIAAKGQAGIAGIHIEGPHLCVARRGTHAAKYVRPMDDQTVDLVRKLRDADIPTMLTLAPEAATLTDIRKLADLGVVVSIGHTDATAAQTYAALDAGAACFTHLFNAMSPMLSRAPGVVGAAINSRAYAGFICDGHHVADEMLGLAIRARPVADRMFLVSDAMPTVGGPARFDLYGQTVQLHDGMLVNDEGSLAGAHVTQLEGVARLVDTLGIAPVDALRMAITIPARVMGLEAELATVVGRPLDDVIVLNHDLSQQQSLPVPNAIAS